MIDGVLAYVFDAYGALPDVHGATRRHAALRDPVVSVDEVGLFKPDPRAYALASQRRGLAPDRMRFVSANAWDARAATAGFQVAWCNRAGLPDEYGKSPIAAGIPDLTALAA